MDIMKHLDKINRWLWQSWSKDYANIENNIKVATLQLKAIELYSKLAMNQPVDADQLNEVRITVVD